MSTLRSVMMPALVTPSLLAIAAFVVLTLLKPNTRIVYDEQSHHLPAIRAFAEQMPTPDLRDYAVATTPGYHLVMAAAVRYLGFGETGLRGTNIAVAMGLAAAVGWMLSRRTEATEAIALALPLVACVYVLTSAAWILPENAAWAGVALILALALEKVTRTTLALMAGALLILVLVRQSHIWCCALLVVAMGIDGARASLRPTRYLMGLAASLPALFVVGAFLLLWGGVVPPLFQTGGDQYEQSSQYGGWGPAAAAFTLALVGLLGTPLVPWLWRAAQAPTTRTFWLLLAAGAALGLMVSIIPETSYQPVHRRSGIWRLIQMTPVIADRSPLLIALAVLGGMVATVALAAQSRRSRFILLTAFVAFVVAQTANPMIWQRYYEPMVLLWLIAAVAYAQRPAPVHLERILQWTGLFGLTLFQITVTLYTLRGGAE